MVYEAGLPVRSSNSLSRSCVIVELSEVFLGIAAVSVLFKPTPLSVMRMRNEPPISENKVYTYLSTPEGKAIAAYHTPMDDSGNLAGAIDHWRQQKVFVTHWVESDFQTQAEVLLNQGSITSREQYLSTLPKGGFHLHFLPFRQGMLYGGSHQSFPSEGGQLDQSLADAFSVAYARYEDFTRLEWAKAQIEKTLTDLKQTQTQLIQSEKMASLGELTAGIAHEIQNPLNFVNNFSELSNELMAISGGNKLYVYFDAAVNVGIIPACSGG